MSKRGNRFRHNSFRISTIAMRACEMVTGPRHSHQRLLNLGVDTIILRHPGTLAADERGRLAEDSLALERGALAGAAHRANGTAQVIRTGSSKQRVSTL